MGVDLYFVNTVRGDGSGAGHLHLLWGQLMPQTSPGRVLGKLGWAMGGRQPGAVVATSSAENIAASKRLYTSRCFCGESKRFCVHQHLFCFLYFGLTSLSQETMQGKSVCFPNSASINLNLQSCSGLYKDLLIKTFAKY